MDKYDKKVLELELELGTPCSLKHNDGEFHRAVNYVTYNVGCKDCVSPFNIPVCQECQDTLITDDTWTLLYCMKCTQNQWVYQPQARMTYYGKHICFMSCCPHCKEQDEQVRIFFID